MKKILFFETPEFTGASRVTHTMAKELQGEYLVAFATDAPNKKAPVKVSAAIDGNNPDIVFCSFASLNPDVIIEGKKKGLQVIVRNDYLLADQPTHIVQRIKETYHLADLVIAQTEESRKELIDCIHLDNAKVIVKENPIDKEGILNKIRNSTNPYPDNGCIHFVWVGRFDPVKDLDMLLKAFAIVHRKEQAIELYLVGNPDNPQKYMMDGVHLVGFQDNPYPWIKYSDCLLLSSKSETNPNVVLESLFLGTPVISTKYNKEVVGNDKHYISSTSRPENFAEQITKLLNTHLWQILH